MTIAPLGPSPEISDMSSLPVLMECTRRGSPGSLWRNHFTESILILPPPSKRGIDTSSDWKRSSAAHPNIHPSREDQYQSPWQRDCSTPPRYYYYQAPKFKVHPRDYPRTSPKPKQTVRYEYHILPSLHEFPMLMCLILLPPQSQNYLAGMITGSISLAQSGTLVGTSPSPCT
jgi:hypothetical protein